MIKLLLLLCVSCVTTKTDPELIFYAEDFKKRFKLNPSPMIFGTIEKGIAAKCYRYTEQEYNYVVVSKDVWHTMSEVQKGTLVIHEQGHCVLNLKHGPGFMQSQIPESFELLFNWDYYIKLFKENI